MLMRIAPWIGLVTAGALVWVGLAGGLPLQETAAAGSAREPSSQEEPPSGRQAPAGSPSETQADERSAVLRQAVQSHWKALASGRKYAALEWVEESSRNDFILRRELPLRSYQIEDIQMQGQDQARVSVRVEALLAGAAQPFTSRAYQHWTRGAENEWKLVYRSLTRQDHEAVFSPPSSLPPGRGRLEVLPSQGLRIHAVDPRRQGVLVISNGGSEPARLTGVVVDEELIEVLEAPQDIEPGQRAAVRLRLLAGPDEPTASTSVLLALKQGHEKKTFSVSVSCNYRSPAALKWFPPGRPQGRR